MSPRELLVYNDEQPCPYFRGRRARLPLRLPVRALRPAELDARLAEGDRRYGPLLYRPACSGCAACEAIRIPIADFRFSGSHRRVLRKGDRAFAVELGEPTADAERVALYHLHKRGRNLLAADLEEELDLKGYRSFLVDRCSPAFELRIRHQDRLVGVSVTDRGADSLSAVYSLWDPDFSRLSVGTFAILKHIELARAWGLRYLYLGLYIEQNAHMNYKARFLPHERLVRGRWQVFERDASP